MTETNLDDLIRTYGRKVYNQQQAFALRHLLQVLGFGAQAVQAFRNLFPDGRVSGHAGLRITYGG